MTHPGAWKREMISIIKEYEEKQLFLEKLINNGYKSLPDGTTAFNFVNTFLTNDI